jgi:hypothetical protein
MVIAAPTDPLVVHIAAVVTAIFATMLFTVLLRRSLDRYLGPHDPRRFHVGRAILYAGTFVAVVLALLIG